MNEAAAVTDVSCESIREVRGGAAGVGAGHGGQPPRNAGTRVALPVRAAASTTGNDGRMCEDDEPASRVRGRRDRAQAPISIAMVLRVRLGTYLAGGGSLDDVARAQGRDSGQAGSAAKLLHGSLGRDASHAGGERRVGRGDGSVHCEGFRR